MSIFDLYLSGERVSYSFLSLPSYLASDCLGYLSYISVLIQPIIKVNLRKRKFILAYSFGRIRVHHGRRYSNKWQAW